jgi:hypothetical protein
VCVTESCCYIPMKQSTIILAFNQIQLFVCVWVCQCVGMRVHVHVPVRVCRGIFGSKDGVFFGRS